MPLFVCDKCGCVENTALGRYWIKDMKDMWDADNEGMALCSECAPTTFKDGSPTRSGWCEYGKWHGKFPKRKWDGKTEVINRRTDSERV